MYLALLIGASPDIVHALNQMCGLVDIDLQGVGEVEH